jgi:hypothetical protein
MSNIGVDGAKSAMAAALKFGQAQGGGDTHHLVSNVSMHLQISFYTKEFFLFIRYFFLFPDVLRQVVFFISKAKRYEQKKLSNSVDTVNCMSY